MQILFIRSNPVKPDSRVEKEVMALLNEGFDVSVLCWDRNDDYSLRREPLNEDMSDVKAYRVGIKSRYGSGIKNIFNLIKWQFAIIFFLKKHHYDIIHACDFDTALSSFYSVDHRKTKFIYDIFDYYADAFPIPFFFRKTIIRLDTHIIHNADLTILCSEQRYQQIPVFPKNSIVIHNSPPKLFFPAPADASYRKTIRIGYFGILSPGRLVEELTDIVCNDDRFELFIGGFGPLEEFLTNASTKYHNIHFFGSVPYKQVIKLETECDILTAIYDPNNRNHYYAAPNKFYESLMLGKPLIMAKNTGMSEIVSNNHFGVLIDYSKTGLRYGLDQILLMKNNWNDISTRMIQLYEERFSWEIMKNRLVSAYRDLINDVHNR